MPGPVYRHPMPRSASPRERRTRSRAEVWLTALQRSVGLVAATILLALSARAPRTTPDTATDWRAQTAILPASALHSVAHTRAQPDPRDHRRSAPPFDAPALVDVASTRPVIRAHVARSAPDDIGSRRARLARGYEATAPPAILR